MIETVKDDNKTALALKGYVDRIVRLETEKKAIADDVKEIYNELESNGFDGKVVKEIIKKMKLDPDVRDEFDGLYSTYKTILGL